MGTLSAIKDGLKTALATVSGLNVYDYFPDQVIVPAAVIEPVRGEELTFRAGNKLRHQLKVTILVSRIVDRVAQDKLDDYLAATGSGSIRAALESDVTLGGACDSLDVKAVYEAYGKYSIGGQDYLGFSIPVEVVG